LSSARRRQTARGALCLVASATVSQPIWLDDDPAHWRVRAEEARTLADEMSDEVSREMMLQIAEGCERLAKHAEERAKKKREDEGT